MQMPDSQYINNRRIQTSEIQMRRLLSLACLILTACAATYFRLNTNQNLRLNVGDSLISTMGLFKATLLQNQCTLSIQTFNGNNAYNKVGNYTSANYTGSCNSLTVANGRIVTDNNFTYIAVGNNSYSISTILTIDDVGVIRLIGTYYPQDGYQLSDELTITTFRTPHTYVYPVSQLSATFMDNFPELINQRDWVFYTNLGQLNIEQYNDAGLSTHYSYSRFTINNSFIGDFLLTPFPGAIFPNITYWPRCLEPRLFIDYKPPYVFVIDPFWPIATVYEQGRYKVVQVRFGHAYEPYAWRIPRRLFSRNQPSVCPPFTFEFRGSCVTTCPHPYYHQLRAEYGYCVLTCEEYTPQNETTRVCQCYSEYEKPLVSSQLIKSCPNNSVVYPYGCYCNETTFYFDRLFSLSCVETCPQGTFPDKGLCMNCPARCLTCQIDKLYRNYLQCRVCQSGYEVVNGNCYRSCSPGQGRSVVSGTCQACTDPNCLDCSQAVNRCKRCNLFYAVFNNACVKSCINNTQVAFYSNLNALCMPKDPSCSAALASYFNEQSMLKCYKCLTSVYLHKGGCVDKCPTNFTANTNNYCFCSKPGTITVNDQCLEIPVCPIKMGWDLLSSSCLPCDFGCLTCFDLSCTSCFPGFFLYVAPQGVSCRRSSPLYTCDREFGWINNACLLKAFSNPMFRLARCLSQIPNCQACYPTSDSICVSCAPGYYNVNNTCIANCPKNTVAYNGLTCIYPEVKNCSMPYLEVQYQPIILNIDIINNSVPYMYYLADGKLYANDPVGNIPIYQNISIQKTDGLFRDSQIFNPSWTCLKCLDGTGLSSDFSQCLPCPDVCLTCYMALNTSCLTFRQKIVTTCPYIDFQTKECVQNCSSSDRIPYISDGILYCYPASLAPSKSIATIDSSTYKAPDGSTYVFFIMDQNLQNSQSLTVPISRQTNAPRTSSDGMPRVSSNIENASYTDGYIYLKDSDPNNKLWIMNVSGVLQKISSSNLALSNTVYGVSSTQDHTSFMKTWLAYIGYIMGLVIICLQVVFIGNDLLYKADNTLILAQSIYFFSFVQLLVGKLLSQFYYGWLFAHFGFFPSFFANTIPSNYVELSAPNSYKLATLDANIVRNAGWAFSLLLVFIGAYAVITFICWVLSSVCNKPDSWHPRIAVNSLIGGIQFLSFPIFYWAVANLLYIGDSDRLSSSFHGTSKAVSICFIVMITVYATIRWFFNPLGGLYMFKRILIATILAAAYLKNVMLTPLIILEVVFCVFRYLMEKPQKKKHLWMLAMEGLLHIAAYLLLFLSLDAGVNTIIISIIIFVMIVVLSYSLTEIYLESQNEWLVEEKDEQSSANSIVAAQADKRRSNAQRY